MADRAPFDRRSFLFAAGAVPALGLGAPRPGEADDMAAAARLSGLEFTAAARDQAAAGLRELRTGYLAIRDTAIPFELPPCAAFDPWPTGTPRPAATARVPYTIARDVSTPATDVDLAFASVAELASLLRQGKVTSRRLTELALARLERFDPQLLCVVNLRRAAALTRADELDQELLAGKDRGPLHGIPYGAKDLFAWPGTPTTFGAAPWKDHDWQLEATCLRRLHDAGAVLVAKLSLGALAMGDVWHGGRTRDPYQPERGSSGSSAGPASAVAAGLLPFAIGTETLGSIVSPCTRCGVAGLRPSFGSVSRHGAMPLSWTMDKVGPIARTAVDAALVFDAMRGADGHDPSARDVAFPWRPGRGLAGIRIGIVEQARWPRRDDEKAFVRWLEDQGHAPKTATLPDAPYGGMLAMLQAESAAAFDDFLRQGRLGELPGQGDNDWPNQFRAARTIPAVEYLQASRARTRLVHAMAATLADFDVVLAPTHGGPTLTATNLTGQPTYVLPVGKDAATGRPTMISLVGKLDGEAEVLAVAEAWQNATPWHQARPTLTR